LDWINYKKKVKVILADVQYETFMRYDINDTEYVFKSVTTDTYITVYIGG